MSPASSAKPGAARRVDGQVALVVGRQVERRVARLLQGEAELVHRCVTARVVRHRPEVGVEVHVAQVLVDRQVERQGPGPVRVGREIVVGVVLGGRRAGGVAPGQRLAVVLAVDVPVELVLVALQGGRSRSRPCWWCRARGGSRSPGCCRRRSSCRHLPGFPETSRPPPRCSRWPGTGTCTRSSASRRTRCTAAVDCRCCSRTRTR